MLVLLGFLMIATFMGLIMTKRLTPLLALIIVPTVFGLFAAAFALACAAAFTLPEQRGVALG